ncbi:MAG: hypothetical protein NZ608_06925 [candidate division WOR-3 bacterium]|nr:hypothetical protein [candidate division WOR-3 bacterium]
MNIRLFFEIRKEEIENFIEVLNCLKNFLDDLEEISLMKEEDYYIKVLGDIYIYDRKKKTFRKGRRCNFCSRVFIPEVDEDICEDCVGK